MKQKSGNTWDIILSVIRVMRVTLMTLLTMAFFVAFSWLDGVINKVDLMNFVSAVITALSFGLTFALAVLAINAFANFREIENLKNSAEKAKVDLVDRAMNIDALAGVLQSMTETISAKLVELSTEPETRDITYFRLLHGRLFLKLLVEQDPVKQINICRDIIGSMEPGDSPDVLRRAVSQLREIRWKYPVHRSMTEPLIHLGERIIDKEGAVL